MTRIEQEKQTVRKMIELYCRHHLKQDTMSDEYQHLAEFACRRLDHCKYGENKTACKDCPTHCLCSQGAGTDTQNHALGRAKNDFLFTNRCNKTLI